MTNTEMVVKRKESTGTLGKCGTRGNSGRLSLVIMEQMSGGSQGEVIAKAKRIDGGTDNDTRVRPRQAVTDQAHSAIMAAASTANTPPKAHVAAALSVVYARGDEGEDEEGEIDEEHGPPVEGEQLSQVIL